MSATKEVYRVFEFSFESLAREVKKHVELGWKPVGGPFSLAQFCTNNLGILMWRIESDE